MSIVWPSTLPQSPLSGTSGISYAPNTVSTPTDVGDPQMRQRYPVGRIIRSGTFQFTHAQRAIFEDFYWKICNSGSLAFWHKDWVVGDFVVFKWFGDPPQGEEEPPLGWRFTLQWSRRRP